MWQKNWAGPPSPLIWTKAKRTAVFFRRTSLRVFRYLHCAIVLCHDIWQQDARGTEVHSQREPSTKAGSTAHIHISTSAINTDTDVCINCYVVSFSVSTSQPSIVFDRTVLLRPWNRMLLLCNMISNCENCSEPSIFITIAPDLNKEVTMNFRLIRLWSGQ